MFGGIEHFFRHLENIRQMKWSLGWLRSPLSRPAYNRKSFPPLNGYRKCPAFPDPELLRWLTSKATVSLNEERPPLPTVSSTE